MKLRESGAVLLIIGSAVVGPIESASLDQAKYRACLAEYSGAQPWSSLQTFERCARVAAKEETTAETCERAMREIGATRDVRGHWWLFETIGTSPPTPNDYNKPAEVRCIPAPSGLKR